MISVIQNRLWWTGTRSIASRRGRQITWLHWIVKQATLVWSAPVNRDSFAYSTPILLDLPGRKVLVGTSRNYIHVVDRQDGTLLSSYRLENIRYGYEHCNSVVHKDGYIYFVACEEHGQGSIKLHLSPDGGSLTEVWRNPEVINVFEGFVVIDNHALHHHGKQETYCS